jgi:eukaryotic-like serine/threonine-protein kinase
MSISAGARFGRYEIRSLLGAGGMGEVYLADDTTLGRAVALKLLSDELTKDEMRVRRFEQEARSASALNHPNIITIHEIGESNGAYFMATEFIDGETLRERMSRAHIKINETIDVALQVAAALVTAHGAGIVHRDIKPENIMVRRDGYVKVLDFGLAKLTERWTEREDSNSEAPTRALVNTDPGTVMGTVQYMSPEQARGLAVDGRTDIWSLGVVLYEMAAGRVPFEGATTSDTISAILGKEPPPLARYAREAPPELEWIVTKALTKDCEERYQTAREMLVDLRRLKQRLDVEAELERSKPPEMLSGGMMAAASGQHATIEMATGSAVTPRTAEVEAARTVSSAEYLVGEVKRHKKGAFVALALLIMAVIGGITWYKFYGRSQPTQYDRWATPLQAMRISRITTGGKTWNAAISPDGRFIAYTIHDADQESLWLRQVTTNTNAQIIPPAGPESRYVGLTFSPDGDYIYYAFYDRNTPQGALYQISAIGGGAPRRVITNINGPIAFSPDGRQIAFLRFNPGQGEDLLMIANADGSGERQIASRRGDTWFQGSGLSWSPDGKVIAAPGGSWTGGMHLTVIVVQVEDGAQRELTSQRWQNVGRVAWLSDGSGLIVTANERESIFAQIWQVSYPGGEARKITNDLNDYGRASLTRDSNALVVTQADTLSNIWIAPDGEASRARQLPSNRYEGLGGLVWTPDGRIVYTSNAGSNPADIWIMNADGTGQRQLTTDEHGDFAPAISPDGRHIVFVSNRTGMPNLWLMDIDGSNQRQLTSGGEDYMPVFTADGQWVVFASWDPGKIVICKVSVNGGDPIQLTDRFTSNPVVSPDGNMIACFYGDEQPGAPPRIALLPIGGGQFARTFELPLTANFNSIRWSIDRRALTYIDTRGGISNIWSQPLDGGAPRQLTNFNDQATRTIFRYDYSRDGRQLLLVRGTPTSDVVMISNVR